MGRLSENKLVLIVRKTRLDELVARFNTIGQAKFYIEHLGADFSDYVNEHQTYYQACREAQAILANLGRVQVLDRSLLPNFLFGPSDVVVALGQDGLVANTLKYLPTQVLIGVNPDPLRWDGVLLPFAVRDLQTVVLDVFNNKRPIREVTLAQVVFNDGQKLLAVNDFFIGQKSHASARYCLKMQGREERQSSSGIIVSTGLGSTGWLKSVMTGASQLAMAIASGQSGSTLPEATPWNADYLIFSVREPFPSRNSSAEWVFGHIAQGRPLKILSEMAENGVVFSDGIESDYLVFNSGIEASIEPATQKGRLAA